MISDKYLAEWAMSAFDFLSLLFRFGHFHSPSALERGMVSKEDLAGLTLDHPIARAAIKSYQEWFKPKLDSLAIRSPEYGGLGRPATPDGDVGPATAELLTFPRCGMPDYSLAEQANWPEACRQQITTSYQMTLNGLSADQLRAYWVASDKNWEDVLELKFIFSPENYPNTRIFAFAASLGGSVLADQYLAQNNCNVRLQGRFGSNRTWNQQLFMATCTHEHGHALGCSHLNDPQATMYPSVTNSSMNRLGAPNNTDIEAMVALGYRRKSVTPPTPPTPNPTPPSPVPPAASLIVSGALTPGIYRVSKEV